jgi:multiple sugar transport system permease protein
MRLAQRYLILAPLLLFTLVPFLWMAQTAIKQDADLYSIDGIPFWFSQWPTVKHIGYLLTETAFLRWLSNSLIVGVLVSAITVVLATLGGYSLSRFNVPLGNVMGVGMFVSYLVPQALLFIPMARVINGLNLQDSLWSLVLVYPTLTVPFCTWFMMGYFRSIPRQLDEAAHIDGASSLQILRRIIVPLALPGILTIGLYSFVVTWQEYLYAITFISSPDSKTLPVAATTDLVRGDVFFWGSLMSAALLGSLPTIVVFAVLSRHFIAGITKGALR